MNNGQKFGETGPESKQEMSFDGFLDHAKSLLSKGYTVDVEDGRIALLSPDGSKYVSVLDAVYADVTGKNPEEYNAPDKAIELGLSDELLDRLLEAETDADTQWPTYRKGLEEALSVQMEK